MKDEIASATISLTAVRGVNIINTAIHFLKALSLNNQGITSGRTIGSKVPNQPADPEKSPIVAIRQGRIAVLKCFHRIVTCAPLRTSSSSPRRCQHQCHRRERNEESHLRA